MYEVNIKDVDTKKSICINEVDTSSQSRITGKFKEGINCINSFEFEIYPFNNGYKSLKEFKTLVYVINTKNKKNEFKGRILSITPSMKSSGAIYSKVVCESQIAFLKDSDQDYEVVNDTVTKILEKMIDKHNSLIEEYKQFKLGNIEFEDKIEFTLKDESTYENLFELIGKINAEVVVRNEIEGEKEVIYIDLLKEDERIGKNDIEISENMSSASYEKDISNIITKLKILGSKKKDSDGKTTEQRLDVSNVNNGSKYVIDEELIQTYGTIVGKTIFDDVSDENELLKKGRDFLKENNKIIKKVKVNCLDLFIIDLKEEEFIVRMKYRIINEMIGLNDYYKLISKTTDINSPHDVTLEFGEKQIDIKSEQILVSKGIEENTNIINSISKEVNEAQRNVSNIENEINKIPDSYVSLIVLKNNIAPCIKIKGKLDNLEELNKLKEVSLYEMYKVNKYWYIYTNDGFIEFSEYFNLYNKEKIDNLINELKGEGGEN